MYSLTIILNLEGLDTYSDERIGYTDEGEGGWKGVSVRKGWGRGSPVCPPLLLHAGTSAAPFVQFTELSSRWYNVSLEYTILVLTDKYKNILPFCILSTALCSEIRKFYVKHDKIKIDVIKVEVKYNGSRTENSFDTSF